MKARFSKKGLRETIRLAVHASKPNGREVCGLLIDNGLHLEILETTNVIRRGGSYRFHVGQILAIKKAVRTLRHEIVGTFHSHPCGLPKPGQSDIDGSLDDSLMLVIDCMERVARLWRIKDKKARPLKYECIAP